MVVPALSSMWAGSADSTTDRSTLRGLKGIKVVIDKLDQQLAADGLTEGRLQAQVEDKLRAAGIVVDDNAKEFLGVGVTSVRGKRTPYALCVTLSLYQVVTLARDPKVKAVAPTWETQDVLMSPPKALREATTESIDTLMSRFIEAYKAANA
jgi:hypothetical protein